MFDIKEIYIYLHEIDFLHIDLFSLLWYNLFRNRTEGEAGEMIGFYDYAVIAVFLAFMVGIGVYFRNVCKNTSDFLRGGGSMSWYLSGASNFMVTFSAWTFVGCAGKIYKTGTLLVMLFAFNAAAYLLIALFFAHRFRRMRVITPIDAVRRRFGKGSEQVYAWYNTIISFIFGGLGLYTLSIFLSPILGLSVNASIWIMGLIITFLAVTGGSWAVAASDFVQALIVMSITIVAAVLVLQMPEVGGLAGFFEKIPSYHFNWSETLSPQIVVCWLIAIFLNQIFSAINLTAGASRFLFVKSDRDARKSALLVAAGFIVGPLFWFIPPMAASFVIPDIAAEFPYLPNPEEASYVAICMRVFPAGLTGLLACGIFAATMSSVNTSLNQISGITGRNIYLALIRPQAGDRELLLFARIATVVLGVLMILLGIWFSVVSKLPLFELTLLLAGLISIPLTMPLVLGIFVRKTPQWAAWSTILVGLLAAYLVKYHLPMQTIAGWMGISHPLTQQESGDLQFALMIFLVSGISCVWFLGSRFFAGKIGPQREKEVAEFFQDMETPVLPDSDEHENTDGMQYRMLGILSLAYGFVTLLGVLIPNPPGGRACFAVIGGVAVVIGALLYYNYRRMIRYEK